MRNLGEMEHVGNILRRCLEAAEKHSYYRPPRRVKPGVDRKRKRTSEQANKQLELFAPPAPQDSRIVQIVHFDPDRPLVDLFPEAYNAGKI